jgi:hypothetical protein
MRARPDLTRMSTPLRSKVFTSLPTTEHYRAFYGDGRAFDGADDFAFLLLWTSSSEGAGRKKQLNTHGYANRQDGSPENPRCGVGKFFALAVP